MSRGATSTSLWQAECKDCRAERLGGRARAGGKPELAFEYSGSWARRKLDRGEGRSDRCERHRRAHARVIQALSTPYIDLRVIGEVPDPANPSGPLGGLGPLPVVHKERERDVDLAKQPFGMSDDDVLHILQGLATKQVAIVEAGTGTGKSTFMPFRLMKPPPGAAFRPTDFGPIVVTEPRRAAATGVARYVGEELCHGCDSRRCTRHFGPGFPVGYQVSGEQHWDRACELIYVTDGTMINWVRDGRLAGIGMVIIDEAHERSENIDIILAQLREAVRQYEHLRVVVTSATLDREFFTSYFGGEERVFSSHIPPAKSFGYGVPLFLDTAIDEKILRDGLEIAPGLKFSGWAAEGPERDGEREDLRATTRRLQALRCGKPIPPDRWRLEMPEAVVRQVVEIARGTDLGDILAFLPTDKVIRDVVARIQEKLGQRFDVYPLLSTVRPDIAEKAIAARSRGERRKIVISSNLAETSLTVKGVRYVVDSGLICQAEWDPALASGGFPTKPHSQSGLRQRWGRVGRDAPGWVFPLYTAEQFLSLAKNTPPETAQANLETFYMKLISSGLDLDETPLPGGYVPPSAELDKAGRDNVELFRRESARARAALTRAGAVDADGHLTAFGREIERFPGEGAHALAVMLADQLACVHEVALALEVLSEGALYGNDPDCILGVDEAWPAAWRVRAAEAHRGLAVGCRDDLDVLLRVVSQWQLRSDRNAWCDRWWINGTAIERAVAAAQEQVAALSAAMKTEAERAVRPELAGRARAVLSRALVSARYRRTEGQTYVAEEAVDEPPVFLSRGLVAAPERLLALNRFRRGAQREDEVRPAEIDHVVELLPWAILETAGHDDLGLELLLLVAARLGSPDAERGLRPLGLLELAPVGALVGAQLAADGTIGRLDVVRDPSAELAVGRYRRRGDHPTAGFDRNWDFARGNIGEVPEEEAARQVLKAQEYEINDELTAAPVSTGHVSAALSLPRLKAVSRTGEVLRGDVRGVVAGYRWEDLEATLVIEERAQQDDGDPTQEHLDLAPWQEVEVWIGGTARDHDRNFLRLDRCDRRGVFYLEDWGAALELHDLDLPSRLRPGARIKARAVPDEHGFTATLLPWARAHLASAPSEGRTKGGERLRAYPAKVVAPPDARGFAVVELDHKDSVSGLAHRFRVRDKDLNWIGYETVVGGEPLLLAVQPTRGERRATVRMPNAKVAKLAEREAALDLQDDRIRLTPSDLPFRVVGELIRAGEGGDWAGEVWRFYEDSLHLSARNLFAQQLRSTLAAPVPLLPFLFRKRAELEKAHDVGLFVRKAEAEIEITATQEAALGAARQALEGLFALPRRQLRIPSGTRGWLLGNEVANLRRLQAYPGVMYLSLDEDVVTVIASSRVALDRVLQEFPRRARGTLSVPAGKAGALIGRGGETIKRLSEASGCRASSTGRDGPWLLDGPSTGHLYHFIGLASAVVPGATGSVREEEPFAVQPEPPHPAPSARSSNLQVAPPDFLVDLDEAEVKRLAAIANRPQASPAPTANSAHFQAPASRAVADLGPVVVDHGRAPHGDASKHTFGAKQADGMRPSLSIAPEFRTKQDTTGAEPASPALPSSRSPLNLVGRPSVSSSTVRQSFMMGRSKTVVVEKRSTKPQDLNSASNRSGDPTISAPKTSGYVGLVLVRKASDGPKVGILFEEETRIPHGRIRESESEQDTIRRISEGCGVEIIGSLRVRSITYTADDPTVGSDATIIVKSYMVEARVIGSPHDDFSRLRWLSLEEATECQVAEDDRPALSIVLNALLPSAPR